MTELDFIGQVSKSLQTEPEKWRQDEFHLRHENGLSFWTASGFIFLRSESPYRRTFNLWQKFRLWRAIRRWEAAPILEPRKPVPA